MNTARKLLERYLEAKDLNRPHLIVDGFTPDAVLTFSFATDSISFPERVCGSDAIAQTLVRDFRQTFTQCRTYYVCDSIRALNHRIDRLPWLVVMRESARPTLRVGRGYYDWRFRLHRRTMRVRAMHIHIERMDAVEDGDGHILNTLQSELPYPWLAPTALHAVIGSLTDRASVFAFLQNFKAPAGRLAGMVLSTGP